MNVVQARLSNQLLDKRKCKKPDEVVSWMGAVQAQDFTAAKWALGLRMRKATDADIENAFNDGAILRTHVMRPTWHFVTPQDIRSLLALTAPRVHAANASMYRKLELEDGLLSRCHDIFRRALRGNTHLTRMELAARLLAHRIEATGQRLAYIVAHAELEALICSGPRRGKQFTYALLEERTGKIKKLHRDEALKSWIQRYFASHGPAQLKDFAWWSGLTLKDARHGVDLASAQLEHQIIDGKTYWFCHKGEASKPKTHLALLLPIYDEYTVAYKDKSVLGENRDASELLSMGNALTSVMVLDGKIAGTWKRIARKGYLEIVINRFRPLTKAEGDALERVVIRYGKFLDRPVRIVKGVKSSTIRNQKTSYGF